MANNFSHISPKDLTDNIFKLIGDDWMLITAANGDDINTMTASWGTAGILWNKPVGICFIRPQRYTYELVEKADHMTFAFFDETYRKALQYCGSHSGREGDKFAAAGLSTAFVNDIPYPAEARLVLICRKLYVDDLREGCFIDPSLLVNYKAKDYHRFYICEIEDVLLRT